MNDIASSIMARLKEETRGLHKHAESRQLQRQIARGDIDRETFAAWLGQLYLIHGALESAVVRSSEGQPVIARVAGADRMRVPDLLADLAFYGVEPESVKALPATARFVEDVRRIESSRAVALLGPLYVLEGSTNGSRFLAQVLRRAWGLEGEGLAYLDPYGDAQPERWASFKREMDGAGIGAADQDAIVDAARATFEAIAEASDQVL
jgi:heme oxygenase